MLEYCINLISRSSICPTGPLAPNPACSPVQVSVKCAAAAGHMHKQPGYDSTYSVVEIMLAHDSSKM